MASTANVDEAGSNTQVTLCGAPNYVLQTLLKILQYFEGLDMGVVYEHKGFPPVSSGGKAMLDYRPNDKVSGQEAKRLLRHFLKGHGWLERVSPAGATRFILTRDNFTSTDPEEEEI